MELFDRRRPSDRKGRTYLLEKEGGSASLSFVYMHPFLSVGVCQDLSDTSMNIFWNDRNVVIHINFLQTHY